MLTRTPVLYSQTRDMHVEQLDNPFRNMPEYEVMRNIRVVSALLAEAYANWHSKPRNKTFADRFYVYSRLEDEILPFTDIGDVYEWGKHQATQRQAERDPECAANGGFYIYIMAGDYQYVPFHPKSIYAIYYSNNKTTFVERWLHQTGPLYEKDESFVPGEYTIVELETEAQQKALEESFEWIYNNILINVDVSLADIAEVREGNGEALIRLRQVILHQLAQE